MKAEIFKDVHKTLKLMYKVQHSSNEFHYTNCVLPQWHKLHAHDSSTYITVDHSNYCMAKTISERTLACTDPACK